jgi:EmrB/QacA subfamily drug resistance transporter
MDLRKVPYKWLVATAFVSGLFMDIMDSTIVNVALPTLSQHFGANVGTLEWVVTGYLVSLAIWIPASGWIGDRFGTKKTFMFALAMFAAGSGLCGLAWSSSSLIAFRLVQGIGGGMMTPVGTTMLFRAFGQSERAKASAVITIPVALAPATGPLLGGWLVDNASWRWIFYVNLPVAMAAFVFTWFFLHEHKEPKAGKFDLWGFICSGSGLALVLLALSRGPEDGWTSPLVLISGVAGIVLLVLMVWIEMRHQNPLLHLRLFADRMFRNANVTMFMAYSLLIGVIFLLPLFLQELRGISPLESGLTTAPQALGVLLMTQVSSRLYPRVGPRRMLMTALAGVSITSALFLLVDLQTSLWWIRAIMFLRGISFSFAIVSSQAATFATISSAETGRASSLFNTNRQAAGSVGVALLATILTQTAGGALSSGAVTLANQQIALSAFHMAFAASIVFGLLGIVFASRIHDEDAASTMARGPRQKAVETAGRDERPQKPPDFS